MVNNILSGYGTSLAVPLCNDGNGEIGGTNQFNESSPFSTQKLVMEVDDEHK